MEAGTDLINAEVLAQREFQLKDLRDRLDAARAEMQSNMALLSTISQTDDPATIATLTEDVTLRSLLSRLDTPEARQSFDNRVDLLTQRLENDVIQMESQIGSLENSVQLIADQVERQNEELIQLQQLQRAADSNSVLYEHFLARLKETAAQKGLHRSDSRILSQAEVPFGPTSPKKSLVGAMCLVLGAVLGAAIVLLRESGTEVYRVASELEATGEVAMGQIPVFPFVERDKVLSYLNENRTSPAAEAIRNLRTSIFLSGSTPPQVICLSSSMPGEGKSTLSLALGQNIAQMGKKVIVIEGDMRRKIFGNFSKSTAEHGFASVLSGKVTLEDAIIHNPDLGADVLHADSSKTNPADLFASQEFFDLMANLRAQYDFIIIDTPPLLVVPDARILVKHVDAMLLVVKWNSTTKSMVRDSLRDLEKVGMHHPGLVLNQINFKKMQGYGYGGRYGNYQNYQGYYNT